MHQISADATNAIDFSSATDFDLIVASELKAEVLRKLQSTERGGAKGNTPLVYSIRRRGPKMAAVFRKLPARRSIATFCYPLLSLSLCILFSTSN